MTDLVVRNSSDSGRIKLLEDLDSYLRVEIYLENAKNEEWISKVKNIRHYVQAMIYSESLKELLNPKIQ